MFRNLMVVLGLFLSCFIMMSTWAFSQNESLAQISKAIEFDLKGIYKKQEANVCSDKLTSAMQTMRYATNYLSTMQYPSALNSLKTALYLVHDTIQIPCYETDALQISYEKIVDLYAVISL